VLKRGVFYCPNRRALKEKAVKKSWDYEINHNIDRITITVNEGIDRELEYEIMITVDGIKLVEVNDGYSSEVIDRKYYDHTYYDQSSIFRNSFMKPEIIHGTFYRVEDKYSLDTLVLPGHVVAHHDPEAEKVEGWFARLSAPGYMDCTDWDGPYKTREEAYSELCKTFNE
jgi:hypothetical protein